MRPVYPNVLAAVRAAWSIPRVSGRSPLAVVSGRDYDAMTADERILQDGMVQQIVRVRFERQPGVIMTLRAMYQEEDAQRKEAREWLAREFQRPGRAPPVSWGEPIVDRWAGWRVTLRSDTDWAKALGVDRRTVSAWRRELRDRLAARLREGLMAMESELQNRGLIPRQ